VCYQILESAGRDYLRLDFDLNERLEGEAQPGRLRPTIAKPKKAYNKYIAEHKKQEKKVNEDIDNPDNCPELIEAAECYLECGKVYYQNQWIPAQEAIEQFVELN
ncbi:MAG: patatin, partial [Limnoraphis sp.]